MKRLLALLLLLCVAGLTVTPRADAAGSVLQATDTPSGVCNLVCTKTFASAVTAGSTLVYFALGSGTSDIVSGVADNVNGAWTRCGEFSNGTNAEWCYYFQNSSAGTITVSVTVTVTNSTQRLSIYELGGVATSGQPDVTIVTGNTASSTSQASTNLTPTSSGDFLLCYLAVNTGSATSFAPASSETEVLEDATSERYQAETKTISGTTATGCSWTIGTARTGGYILFAAKVSGATVPTLTSCTAAPNNDGYTVNCTSNTTATIYTEALLADSTAPTLCSTIIAHSGAAANANGSIAAGAVSVTLTGLDNPIYDVHTCSSNAAGSTVVRSSLAALKHAPTGKQYIIFSGLNDGSDGTDPSPYYNLGTTTNADVLEAGLVVLPDSITLSIDGSGNISFVSSGAREYDDERIYDRTAKAWESISGAGTYFRMWFNNHLPTPPASGSTVIYLPFGTPMVPLDLRPYCPDPDGDTVTVTAPNNDTPDGTSIISSILQGTPLTKGVYNARTLRCCDSTGACIDWQ